MTKDQMTRLEPFLQKKTARQRVILALLAEGHEISELENWTIGELEKSVFKGPLAFYRDQVLEERKGVVIKDPAFCYPNGQQLKAHDLYRILRQATAKVMGEPAAPAAFRTYIKTGKN